MIGIMIAAGAVVVTFLLKGVSPVILINLPAIAIVLAGTFGATIGSFGMADFLRFPKLAAIAMKSYRSQAMVRRQQLVAFAERARREGLLALESDIEGVDDAFLKRGLQMVIDGLEPEVVEEVLALEIEAMKRRHARGALMFGAMAGYAPTFGILGAVMGLIAVMAHLSEPEKLGSGIQVAFIATLLAVGIANILFMPISMALKARSAEEVVERQMALAGILAVQAGDNPRIVAQKLDSFIDPKVLAAGLKVAAGSAAAATAAASQAEAA